MFHLDRYTLNARVLPMLVVAFPLVLAAFPWLPAEAFVKDDWAGMALKALTTGTGAAVVATLLSFPARTFGTRLEERLWREWGGAPSTQYLRYRHPELDRRQTGILHAKIARLDPSLHVPSAEEEERDPAGADQCYESMVRVLRARTWGPKSFPLLFDENVSYGFRRNLLGMRPLGIAASLLGMVSGAIAIWFGHFAWPIVTLCAVAGLYVLVNGPRELRKQAERYARRLFETVDRLLPTPAAPQAKEPKAKPRRRSSKQAAGEATGT
ncbi:hypothetical protein OKC48_07295 [Methylorubrum extorquens]|uniref:hypothetical protein n=1 Tax=Methylorubrum extorquens TaxID=408 RepID=UPI002238D30C|nr:hypothetical protein [Methylorubrum extorquens]UYW28312.1 hypothetical protein OKC48_07295 [Methylorubrum extorquens]